jgi:hypothetical protein
MSKWVHQAHQVLRLACATIAKDGCGWREAEHASRGKSSALLEVANLPGLAMRVMVALTDTSTWKCFCESGQEARKKKADQVVLSLAEWLANGNGGLFLAVRAYLLANYPVPGIKDEQTRPHGRKDKFIVTASIITVMLRPLLLLSVASIEDRDQNSEGLSEGVQFKASAARAAAQLSAHILTIPFLSQRLPSSLLPALKHPSALFPCIRALGVPISSLLVRLASSTSSSLNSQLGRADAQLGGVPFSAWALGNVVCLAMDSPQSKGDAGREFSAHFVSGLICEEYVQALCCLLDDLDPWLDVKRKRQREEKAVSKDNEDVGPCSEDASRGNGSVKVLEATIFQLLVESLRPLHHQWHLLQLLHEASLKGGQPVIDNAAGRKSVGGVSAPKFGLAVVAKLYANLLSAFAVLNPFGGALPVLNLLAFTPTLLPQLWDWLRTSQGLAHLITAEVEGESQQFHGTHMAPVKAVSDDKYGKTPGSRWAGAFGWKLRSRSRSTSTSQAAERADGALQRNTPNRSGFVPPRLSVDERRADYQRMPVANQGGFLSTGTPDRQEFLAQRVPMHGEPAPLSMVIDNSAPSLSRVSIDRLWCIDGQLPAETSEASEVQWGGERSRMGERQALGVGRSIDRLASHGEASRSVDMQWGVEGNSVADQQEFYPGRRSVDGWVGAGARRLGSRQRGADASRPLRLLHSIRCTFFRWS